MYIPVKFYVLLNTLIYFSGNSPLAFTAVPNEQRTYAADEKMFFENALTNLGGGYNATDSTFTCIYHGLYMFSIVISNESPQSASGRLVVNGAKMIQGGTDTGSEAHNQGSNRIFLECNTGDVVWVNAYHDDNTPNTNYPTSSFSGVLLRVY